MQMKYIVGLLISVEEFFLQSLCSQVHVTCEFRKLVFTGGNWFYSLPV